MLKEASFVFRLRSRPLSNIRNGTVIYKFVDIPRLVFGEHVMIAGVKIAIVLHHTGMAADFCCRAQGRRDAHPVGQYTVEGNNKIISYILPHPFVEDVDQEVTIIQRIERPIGNFCLLSESGSNIESSALPASGLTCSTIEMSCMQWLPVHRPSMQMIIRI